jgi:hypothetical protein
MTEREDNEVKGTEAEMVEIRSSEAEVRNKKVRIRGFEGRGNE